MRNLSLLLAMACLLAVPNPADAARRGKGPRVDTGTYRSLFQGPSRARGFEFERFVQRVVLDEEEAIERHFEVTGTAPPERLVIAVVDRAMGEGCEAESGGSVELVPQPTGFGHLGDPWRCELLPDRSGGLDAHVVVYRPRLPRLDHRFALFVPVQPLGAPAQSVELSVEEASTQGAAIRPHGWSTELSRQLLAEGRHRSFITLERVAALLLPSGVDTISGRVPALAITSGEEWDALVLDHRAFFDGAARAKGEVITLAARVLSQPDRSAMVREAVRIALDEIELDPSGGRGGGWQLPRRASSVAADGVGTTADRAALLIALLRINEIRAEVVLASRSHHRVAPGEPLALLNQTLVLLPDDELVPGGGPLFIDPSRPSTWFGALEEPLIGRDAVMLGPRGARWLRLPGAPPLRSWTLNASETDSGFDVQITGTLGGAPAARVRDWAAAGSPADAVPAADLAWLGLWIDALDVTLEEVDGGRLRVAAAGKLARDVALPEGTVPVPSLPRPAPDRTDGGTSWPYARDALRSSVDLLESWTFRRRPAAASAPTTQLVTPFWAVDAFASWSGPLFSRRARLAFTGDLLAPAAALEVERFLRVVQDTLGGVAAP